MATATYLSISKVEIGTSSASVTDITDQVSSVTVNEGFDALPNTSMASVAHTSVKGLQNNSASLTLYASYAASESYAVLSVLVGTQCYLRVTPTTAALSATNPGFELTNTFFAALPVINSNIGELAMYDIELSGGEYTADITP